MLLRESMCVLVGCIPALNACRWSASQLPSRANQPTTLHASTGRRATLWRRTQRIVSVRLIDCDLTTPVEVEETLADGRVLGAPTADHDTHVRLHLDVINGTSSSFDIGYCSEGLAVVPKGADKPYCGPLESTAWHPLAPGTTVSIYPTVAVPPETEGPITQTLLPRIGHAPIDRWPKYRPHPVSFFVTSAGCIAP